MIMYETRHAFVGKIEEYNGNARGDKDLVYEG